MNAMNQLLVVAVIWAEITFVLSAPWFDTVIESPGTKTGEYLMDQTLSQPINDNEALMPITFRKKGNPMVRILKIQT